MDFGNGPFQRLDRQEIPLRGSDRDPSQMARDEALSSVETGSGFRSRVLHGGIIVVLGQLVQLVLSTGSTIALARLLSPEDFGLVAMVAPFVGLLGFIRDSGLHVATVQNRTISHDQISTLFWLNVALSVALMTFMVFLAGPMATFFGRPELKNLTFAYAAMMLLGGLSIQHSALLYRRMEFKKITLITIGSQILGIVIALLMTLQGYGYWSLVGMAFGTSLSQVFFSWSAAKWVPGPPRRGAGVRKMLAFGGGLAFSNMLNQFTQYADNLLVARLMGAAPLGNYDRAKQLFLMPLNQLMTPVGNVALPALSRVAEDEERYRKVFLRFQEKLLLATAIVSGFFVVYGDWVVNLLLGPKWHSAGPLLQAVAIGGIIIPVSSSVTWLLVTQGRSLDLAKWSPVSFLFRCLGILAGYRYGVLGVALSISTFQFASFLAFSLWAGRTGNVSFRQIIESVYPTVVACMLAILLGVAIKNALPSSGSWLSLVLAFLVHALSFVVLLLLFPRGKRNLLDTVDIGKSVARKFGLG